MTISSLTTKLSATGAVLLVAIFAAALPLGTAGAATPKSARTHAHKTSAPSLPRFPYVGRSTKNISSKQARELNEILYAIGTKSKPALLPAAYDNMNAITVKLTGPGGIAASVTAQASVSTWMSELTQAVSGSHCGAGTYPCANALTALEGLNAGGPATLDGCQMLLAKQCDDFSKADDHAGNPTLLTLMEAMGTVVDFHDSAWVKAHPISETTTTTAPASTSATTTPTTSPEPASEQALWAYSAVFSSCGEIEATGGVSGVNNAWTCEGDNTWAGMVANGAVAAAQWTQSSSTPVIYGSNWVLVVSLETGSLTSGISEVATNAGGQVDWGN
jgi:hypothetical protein